MNRAKYRARIAHPKANAPAFLDTELRDDYDRRQVLLGLYNWIKTRLYLPPSGEDLADKREWSRAAVQDLLGDLEALGSTTWVPGQGWAITPAGSSLLEREHVVPLLPSTVQARKLVQARLYRINQDLQEFEALRTHLGVADYGQLYKRLFHAGTHT